MSYRAHMPAIFIIWQLRGARPIPWQGRRWRLLARIKELKRVI
jgi:hypothetical protein